MPSHRALCALRSALCALRSALCALRSALCALRSALCALRSALCALRSALCAMRYALCALRSELNLRIVLRSELNLRIVLRSSGDLPGHRRLAPLTIRVSACNSEVAITSQSYCIRQNVGRHVFTSSPSVIRRTRACGD